MISSEFSHPGDYFGSSGVRIENLVAESEDPGSVLSPDPLAIPLADLGGIEPRAGFFHRLERIVGGEEHSVGAEFFHGVAHGDGAKISAGGDVEVSPKAIDERLFGGHAHGVLALR